MNGYEAMVAIAAIVLFGAFLISSWAMDTIAKTIPSRDDLDDRVGTLEESYQGLSAELSEMLDRIKHSENIENRLRELETKVAEKQADTVGH